jgi:hypothetical protein
MAQALQATVAKFRLPGNGSQPAPVQALQAARPAPVLPAEGDGRTEAATNGGQS